MGILLSCLDGISLGGKNKTNTYTKADLDKYPLWQKTRQTHSFLSFQHQTQFTCQKNITTVTISPGDIVSIYDENDHNQLGKIPATYFHSEKILVRISKRGANATPLPVVVYHGNRKDVAIFAVDLRDFRPYLPKMTFLRRHNWIEEQFMYFNPLRPNNQ